MMKRSGATAWLIASTSIATTAMAMTIAPAHAEGADQVRASAVRADGSTLEVFAVVTPSGTVNGRVEYSTTSLGQRTGRILCGSVTGATAVVGGYDDTGASFTIAMSDDPDGFILGQDRPPCDTTGFGDPASLPITSGDIEIIDR